MLTDLEFVTGAGGRHVALKINGVPCAYLTANAGGFELRCGRTAPAFLRDGRKQYLSLEGAKNAIIQAAKDQPHQMVIAL